MTTLRACLANWKTTLFGGLGLLCGIPDLLGVFPPEWHPIALGVCTTLVSLGLITAKDSDKSNASSPTDTPHSILKSPAKTLLIGLVAVGLR